ncbi:MAG: hypothetical protein ACOYVF_01015 [Candidatus Zixiibacteriota bacterium]
MKKYLLAFFLILTGFAGRGQAGASDLVGYVLSDLRVLYLYETPEEIDWPTLYYLNETYFCRIDLLSVRPAGTLHYDQKSVRNREIYLNKYYVDDSRSDFTDSLFASLFAVRRPDIVIFAVSGRDKIAKECMNCLTGLPFDSTSLFNISKIYRFSEQTEIEPAPPGAVFVNRHELLEKYNRRIALEVPELFPHFSLDNYAVGSRLGRYDLLRNLVDEKVPTPDFTSGLHSIRLVDALDSLLSDGAIKEAFIRKAKNALSFLNASRNSVGSQRSQNIITGYKELIYLANQSEAEGVLAGIPDYVPYLKRLLYKAQRATLYEIGMDWEGRVFLRDSPHGPKLKFLADLAVNGSEAVELAYIKYKPYWDTAEVTLDATSRKIKPHQSFIREYNVDIDPAYLESQQPESLAFTAEIIYGKIQMPVVTTVPMRQSVNLKIAFEPEFRFVPPTARLDIDRVVSSLNWKAIISKPLSYEGKVKVYLETPTGVFAGAYKTEWALEKGTPSQTIRIPFSVSNLFELGIHPQIISLIVDDRLVSADTGLIRIASCQIADTLKIGFLPDSTGLLEEILRMTDAAFQPLTDRSLLTGDLDAFNVIIVGSGAFRNYPSLAVVKERIIDYLRYGGSLVIMGQPYDWPEGILPVTLNPITEAVQTEDITNRIPQARLLSQPHNISENGLLAHFRYKKPVASAVVMPSERVYVTPSGGTLLSVSRLGEGQIIYCGLPLVEMISKLDIEAIHLLANILNY